MNEHAHQNQVNWYCHINGEKQGPMSAYKVETLVIGNIVGPDTLIWNSGLPHWVRLGESSLRSLLDGDARAPTELFRPPEHTANRIARPPQTGLRPNAAVADTHRGHRVNYHDDLSLWQYFKRCITSQYAGFHGRARRKEYWGFSLFSLIFYLSGAALIGIAIGLRNPALVGITSLALFVGAMAILLPTWAAGVRRLHDVGISGWLMLISFVPYIGALILLVLFLLPSQSQDNQHGPIPPGV